MTLTQSYKFEKLGPKTKNLSILYEIRHSQQIEHANYEYNNSLVSRRSRDYYLRMILGSEWS